LPEPRGRQNLGEPEWVREITRGNDGSDGYLGCKKKGLGRNVVVWGGASAERKGRRTVLMVPHRGAMCLARAVAHEGQGEEPVLPWTLDENRDLGATRLGFTPGAARARKLIFGPRRFTGRLSEAPDPPPALRGSSPRPTKYTTRAWSKVARRARHARAAMALFENRPSFPPLTRPGRIGFRAFANGLLCSRLGMLRSWVVATGERAVSAFLP
jgi:hypothetical protein